MAKRQFRAELVSGPPNIRRFTQKTGQSYAVGDLVKESSGICAVTGTVSTGIHGVAVKAGGSATASLTNLARVSVITPEQVWKLHMTAGKKPSSCTVLNAYKLKITSNASFTITRLNEATSTTVSVKGPVVGTTVAATANQGVIVMGYADGLGAKKGQCVLVRFAAEACAFKT